jgi:hypothetical protein
MSRNCSPFAKHSPIYLLVLMTPYQLLILYGKRKVKRKLSLGLSKYHAMKTYGGVDIQPHAFLTSALNRCEWSASRSGRFKPEGKTLPHIHCIGGWVGHGAGMDAVTMRRNLIIDSAGDRSPVIQPVAQVSIPTVLPRFIN